MSCITESVMVLRALLVLTTKIVAGMSLAFGCLASFCFCCGVEVEEVDSPDVLGHWSDPHGCRRLGTARPDIEQDECETEGGGGGLRSGQSC